MSEDNSNSTGLDVLERRREERAAARAERRAMTSSMTTSYTADAPPVAAADDAPPAVTPASNMSQHERQRKYDAKMEEMGMTSGAPDDAKSVNTASSTAAVSVGSNTTTTTTTTRSSNSTSNARSVPFSNMSERERQRRYDSKMADMGIVEEGAADAAPAPVQASRPGGPRNTTFSNMSEDERQRKYEAKMGEGNDPAAVAGAAHTANNNTNDNVSQKILNDYASQTSSKEITLGGGSSTNTNNNGITTTANYGMATAPQVEYGTYEVLQSEKENEKAVPVRTSEGEFAGGDLAVAMAINEDEEAALGGKIAYAMEYDPDSKPPVYKNRRFQLYGVIGVILLIVVGAGVGIGVSSGGSDDTSRSMDQIPMATNPPTIFLTVKEDKVYNFLTTYFSPKVMEEGTPHKMAAEWSLKEDRLSDDMTEGDLGIDFLQRYVLAFLWYHTTDNGNKPWRSCNPRDVTVDENDTCTFLKWEQLENDDVCFKEVEGVNRWMSGAETCLWQGVDCSSGSEVLGIDLFWQGLTGTLPTELVALTSLQKVMFAYNELTGQIPPEYANIRTLFSLEIHGNVLTGKIPDAFYEAASETGALVLLNVGDNQLSGTLDTRIGLMTDLKGLHFFDNKFTGTLPTELGNLRYLSYSRGHGNQLSGSLPTELGRVRQLTEFWYHQCGLSGSIPSEMGKMKRMKSFRIWGNDLSGPIPEELYAMTNMERFELQENALSGSISPSIANMATLEEFRVSSNKLQGEVPSELGSLRNLKVAWLHQNDLTGIMPDQICSLAGLIGLQADCDPEGAAAVECTCCTSCCEQGFGLGTCFFREGFEEPTLPPNMYDPYLFCAP